ncbi:S-layer homology domain-containing protein [Gorillibacterium timonense]|uniref:S-layer homology domain-containing protein n=1 Tax=Gorillibacterium timonense TaxID=1689269 RepID=UPI00071C3CBB|nr:S-layer homology domain-containing protein [Gorillibacterium timonense]
MKRMTHWTAKTALTLAVLTGSVIPATAFADTAAGTAAVSWKIQAANQFLDVKSTYWGAKDIAKLSMLGIVQGYNGSFTPEKEVSHQDAIVMAVRMMGYEEEALTIKNSSIPLVFSFGLSDYAKPYVKVALDHNLIGLAEIPEHDANWGISSASREWIARVIIRLADKDSEALSKTLAPTAFKDGDSITDELVGYVNEAVDLGIVNGFEDGTFRPAVAVTRSQAAALLNRASVFLAVKPGNAITGTVTYLDSSKLSLMTDEGVVIQADLTGQTLIYKDKTLLSASTLKVGNLVDVIVSGTTAYFVDWKSDQGPVVANGEGIAVSLNATDKKISLAASTGQVDYSLTELAYESVKNLVAGDKIRYQLYGTKMVSAQIVPVVKGEIVTIDPKGTDPLITLKKSDGKLASFYLTSQPKVTSPLKSSATLSDLYKGDQVAIELDASGNPVSISVVISTMTNYYQARIESFNATSKYLTVTVNGTPKVFKLDDKTVLISSDGKESVFYTALYPILVEGRKLDLVAAGDKLLKLKIASQYTATVTSVDLNSGDYTVKLDDGQTLSFTWKTNTKVLDSAGKTITFDQVAIGKKVKLTYEQSVDQVTQIQLVN